VAKWVHPSWREHGDQGVALVRRGTSTIPRNRSVNPDCKCYIILTHLFQHVIDRPTQQYANTIALTNIDKTFEKKPGMLRVLQMIFSMNREKFLDPNTLSDVDSKQIGEAINIFLRHQLGDQLFDAIGYPSNPDCASFGRVSMMV
jgi:hypothetical protein